MQTPAEARIPVRSSSSLTSTSFTLPTPCDESLPERGLSQPSPTGDEVELISESLAIESRVRGKRGRKRRLGNEGDLPATTRVAKRAAQRTLAWGRWRHRSPFLRQERFTSLPKRPKRTPSLFCLLPKFRPYGIMSCLQASVRRVTSSRSPE